jgi:hypothetical protein
MRVSGELADTWSSAESNGDRTAVVVKQRSNSGQIAVKQRCERWVQPALGQAPLRPVKQWSNSGQTAIKQRSSAASAGFSLRVKPAGST